MANKTLNAAKGAKNDEFYTQRSDIENELSHYAEHFRDKVVYCNCDDPESSEFWRFFVRNFMAWGLKKLIATHYEPNAQNYSYKLEMEPDENGQFSIYGKPTKTPLPCNGDFRSAACIELLEEADIVVTNPPFSLFREYIAQLMEYKKKFLIIGNKNCLTLKGFFPLVQKNLVWCGYTPMSKDMLFGVPDYMKEYYMMKCKEGSQYRIIDGELYARSSGCWFTNLDIPKRHAPLDLRGNYYEPEKYPKYDNYDAIEVSKVSDIPCNFSGVMGVPVSFMDKYNPDQFDIVGITLGNTGSYEMTCIYENAVQHNKDGSTQGGSKVNTRAAIRVAQQPSGVVYYTASNADGYLLSIYPRILIKRKE